MDLLKAEIERKRRVAADATGGHNNEGTKKKRYVKASELRKIEQERRERDEEEEWRLRQDRRRRKKRKRRDDVDDDLKDNNGGSGQKSLYDEKNVGGSGDEKSNKSSSADKGQSRNRNARGDDGSKEQSAGTGHDGLGKDEAEVPESLRKHSPEEVTNMLRFFGLPVRLFGEVTIEGREDRARLVRLHGAMEGREKKMAGDLEADEYRLGSGHGIRNPFLERDEYGEDDDAINNTGLGKEAPAAAVAEAPASAEEEDDPPKKIYRFFKNLLRQWEDDLSKRPDAVRRTAAGKNETKTLKQCKDYIRPLFKQCKTRRLEPDLQTHICNIVMYCEQGEFVKAHDSYLDMAIGRAAWPIGVTMVGIHARSGRAKIASSNVAHVMNSELHRKYLTSVKRLMTYAQKKRPDVDPSKKVMNL